MADENHQRLVEVINVNGDGGDDDMSTSSGEEKFVSTEDLTEVGITDEKEELVSLVDDVEEVDGDEHEEEEEEEVKVKNGININTAFKENTGTGGDFGGGFDCFLMPKPKTPKKNEGPRLGLISVTEEGGGDEGEEEEQFYNSEAFASADNALDWDMLMTRGSGNTQPTRAWERESLYVKFDPLIASKQNNAPADRLSFTFKAPKPPGLPTSARQLACTDSHNNSNASMSELYITAREEDTSIMSSSICSMPVIDEGTTTSPNYNDNVADQNGNNENGENDVDTSTSRKDDNLNLTVSSAFGALSLKDNDNNESEYNDGAEEDALKSPKPNLNVTKELSPMKNVADQQNNSNGNIGGGDGNLNDSVIDSIEGALRNLNISKERPQTEVEVVADQNGNNENGMGEVDTSISKKDNNLNLSVSGALLQKDDESEPNAKVNEEPPQSPRPNLNVTKELSTSEDVTDQQKNKDSSVASNSGEGDAAVSLAQAPVTVLLAPAGASATVTASAVGSGTITSGSLTVRQESSNPNAPVIVINDTSGYSDIDRERLARIAKLKEEIAQLKIEDEKQRYEWAKRGLETEQELEKAVDEFVEARDELEAITNETKKVEQERVEALEDLKVMEKKFAEMLMLYEGIKEFHPKIEKNIETLKKREVILQQIFTMREKREETTQNEFQRIVELMKSDFDRGLKEKEDQNKKLNARVKMSEMKVAQLEGQIAQVDQENKKLRVLCDDIVQERR